MKTSDIQAWLVTELCARLGHAPEAFDVDRPFEHYGLDSLEAVTFVGDLEKHLARQLPSTLLWEHRTVAALASYLAGLDGHKVVSVLAPQASPNAPYTELTYDLFAHGIGAD